MNATEKYAEVSAKEYDHTIQFFGGLCHSDSQVLEQNLNNIINTLFLWIKYDDLQIPGFRKLLKIHLPTVLRLMTECPLEVIRQKCKQFMEQLSASHPSLTPRRRYSGPSLFIPNNQLIPFDSADTERFSLLVDVFQHDCRTSHMIRVLIFQPEYFRSFMRTFYFLMRCDGPLPVQWRYYIAILATARHRCKVLTDVQIFNFLSCGGDPSWIEHIHNTPRQIQKLSKLNALLAHKPWLVNSSLIKELNEGEDALSLSGIVQAIVLMATFHSLAGFVFGCGLTPEIDLDGGHWFEEDHPSGVSAAGSNSASTGANSGRQSGVFSENPTDTTGSSVVWTSQVAEVLKALELKGDGVEDFDVDQNIQVFKRIESEPSYIPPLNELSDNSTFFQKFILDDIAHEDFDVKADNCPIFRSLDYSWPDHGYSLVNRFYPDIAQHIEDEFNIAREMTDNRLGDNHHIDTSKFRQAIWFYIHRITGILHDDYNYSEVNKLLERTLKAYVKKLTCFPQLVKIADFISFGANLRDSEKVHINLFAMEARKQAELLHGLRAVMEYVTSF